MMSERYQNGDIVVVEKQLRGGCKNLSHNYVHRVTNTESFIFPNGLQEINVITD